MMNIQIQKRGVRSSDLPLEGLYRLQSLAESRSDYPQRWFHKEVSPSQNEVNSELVWLPGFVDTHVHYPQHRVRARSSGQLLPWLNQTIFPEEQRFRNDEYADISR